MKRIKLYLLSAAIVAAGSAFIPAVEGEPYVLVDGTFIPKNPSMGSCVDEGTICTYTLLPEDERENINPPYSAADFSSNPSEQKTWVPN